MRALVLTTALVTLVACSPSIPDSGAGVVPEAAPVTAQPLGEGADIAAETSALLGLGTTPAATTTGETVGEPVGAPLNAMSADASNAAGAGAVAATTAGTGSAAISDEQSFSAVASRETIQSDAARLAENRAKYVVIEPTQLPQREGGNGASVVQYALKTNNPVGQQLYSRSSIAAQTRFERACAQYPSPDQAQQVFLDSGGPKRDPKGMDPDGDGFACYWDPIPFRTARQGAPEVVTKYVDVETPGISE